MDAGDTLAEYREMFRKAGFRGRSRYPLAALGNGCDFRKMSQRRVSSRSGDKAQGF
jgi:hypothetical protein